MTASPSPARPRRRWRRLLLLLFVVLAVAVLLLPYALALPFVRGVAADRLSAQLGVPCRIEALSWSWSQGVVFAGLEIDNPPGFTTERPCLRVRSLTADPLRGLSLRPDVHVAGFELFVEQRADGRTNVQAIGRGTEAGDAPEAPEPSPAPEPAPAPPPDRDPMSSLPAFDLAVQEGRIEIRRDGRLLETATAVTCRVGRAPGADRTEITAAADLTAGRTSLALTHGDDGNTHAELQTDGLDLAQWAPLVAALAPDRVTTLAGKAVGALTADVRDGAIVLGGDLTVQAPRLGGPALRGMTLGGERWTLRPNVTLGRGADTVDASALAIDLGWFTLRGAPPPADAPHTFAARCTLDVAALAAFGGPMPTWLEGTGASLDGELRVPTRDLPTDAEGWTQAIAATLRLSVPRLDVAGFAFTDLVANGTLRDGAFALATADGARLDGGALVLSTEVDLRTLATLPLSAQLAWRGGRLHGGTTQVLRYAVPLLAGVPATGAALTGLCDVELQLTGPALRQGEQGWIAWLDAWRGSGSVGLREAAVQPTAALQPLLQPLGALTPGTSLGDGGRLAIDSFTAPFSFAEGAVRTTASEWLAKGKRLGLSGSVGFDGALAYDIDLSALLQGHRDGERALQALDGRLPPARIAGTLDAPKLALPDLTDVLRRVLEGAAEQRGKDVLQRALDELLKKR